MIKKNKPKMFVNKWSMMFKEPQKTTSEIKGIS